MSQESKQVYKASGLIDEDKRVWQFATVLARAGKTKFFEMHSRVPGVYSYICRGRRCLDLRHWWDQDQWLEWAQKEFEK
jgi:hypothetical protein